MPTSVRSLVRRRVLILAIIAFAVGAFMTARKANSQSAPAPQPAAPGSPSGFDFAGQREEIFKAFYSTGLDTSTSYTVANLALKKDNMTLLLKQGQLFLLKPIGGEVTGAVFMGDGEASMTPPNRTQRFMLNKYSGSETLKEPFTEALFRFSDGTDKILRVSGKAGEAGAEGDRASQILKDRNGWLDGTRELHLEMQFLENRISGLKGQDFFIADLHTPKHEWLSYVYDQQDIHENALFASETMGSKNRRYRVSWAQWHKQADYDPAGHYVIYPDRDGARVIRIKHTDLSLDLRNTKTIEWEARTTVEPVAGGIRCLRFDLVNNANSDSRWYDESFWPARVLSVADASGTALPFMHKKDQLLVILPSTASPGAGLTISTRGQADMIYQVTAESFGLIQGAWYPQYGRHGGRSTFHWTIRVPRPFTVTGSGRLVREFEDKETNQNGIETASDIPVTFPWAIFGKFRKAEDTFQSEEPSKKAVKISIHTVSIQGGGTPDKKVQDFFVESKDIIKLYENIYGPYPYEELHIAQMGPDLGFGQGPPYFVQLTGELFLPGESHLGKYSVHDFLSHEISHQWWGNQIGWASDDDDWLSEGFASYAAGVWIHALQKKEGLQRMLDGWRMDAKQGDKEAPILAASMLSGPNADDYRRYLLYNKAPYVLHMLRVQLDDAKYRDVMRGVNETYRNQDVSTEMLLRELNRVTGADYSYFFDQWIWDIGIPKFRYSWRSERQPDGKFLITLHVSQEDKNHLKRVLMPIHIHAKGATIPPQYKGVTQLEQDIKLLVPVEPKDVTLDDEHTLLADIVKAG